MTPNKKFFINYYKNDLDIFRYIGGWLITEETRHKKIWMAYLFIVIVLFGFLVNSLQILHIFELTDLIDVVNAGFITTISLMGSIKTFFVFKNRKELIFLVNYMKEEIFLPRNKTEEAIVMESLNFHRKIKYIAVTLCTAAIVASMMTPLFKYGRGGLIFQAWYPFDLTPQPLYVLVYLHQTIADFYISYMNVYLDLVVAGFTTFVGMQCDLLCHKLENMGMHRVDTKLRRCIDHHRMILRFAKTTEKVFSEIYFGQFAASTAALSMTLFLITLVERASFEFCYLVLYQASMFSLLLIPCWFTSEMKRKSENIPNAAYSCPWVEGSKTFKKEVLYFIHITQTPITMFAIGFFQISVETFILIVRSSFAYYTVLNNLNMQNN